MRAVIVVDICRPFCGQLMLEIDLGLSLGRHCSIYM